MGEKLGFGKNFIESAYHKAKKEEYKQNKIYYEGDKVNIGFKIYKCLSQINSGNYDINNLSQFELIYSGE